VVHRYYDEESEARLTRARERAVGAGIPFDVEKRVGNPAEEIVNVPRAGSST
jgi:nucleotide-binding universal stress UspA family protein